MKKTEIDHLVEKYIAQHPAYRDPRSGDTHPAVLASTGPIKEALIESKGGPLAFYRALLAAAKSGSRMVRTRENSESSEPYSSLKETFGGMTTLNLRPWPENTTVGAGM